MALKAYQAIYERGTLVWADDKTIRRQISGCG